jgi:hypothetical protein
LDDLRIFCQHREAIEVVINPPDQTVLVGVDEIPLEDVYAAGFDPWFCSDCGYWHVESEDEVKLLALLNRKQ